MVPIFRGVRCYNIVVLIYISLMTEDIEHLFRYLSSICISSLEKISIEFLCPFFSQIGQFFVIAFYKFFIYFGYNLSNIWFGNNFFHSAGCLFIFLIVYFAVQKLFCLIQFQLLIFCFWCHPKNCCQEQCQGVLFSLFS